MPTPLETFLDDSFNEAIEKWRKIGLHDIREADTVLHDVNLNLENFCKTLRNKAEKSYSRKLKDFVEDSCSSIEKKNKK